MRKMRKINVFSIVAVLALVILLGCTFIPNTTIKSDVPSSTMSSLENKPVEQLDNENEDEDEDTAISAAVFVNPDYSEADD